MSESYDEYRTRRNVEEALKGKKLPMTMPNKNKGSSLPLVREVLDILDALGGMLEEKQSVQNVLRALEIAGPDGMFCDRCSHPLGVQVKMVPTADGPVLELIIACTEQDGQSCEDQSIVILLTPEREEEEED